MREVAIAAAQMGPIARDESRADVVERLLALLHTAHGRGAQLVVYPELALTTFFPRYDLQGDELVLIGYNTPIHYAPDPNQDRLAGFHNHLVMASGAYQNGTWVVGVGKGGVEEGVDALPESQIIAPNGEVVAKCTTSGDEVVVAVCDLDRCAEIKGTVFDFA